VAKILHEHYGIEPKARTHTYHKPYTKIYDSYPYPPKFRVSEFIKFTGEDNRTT
jgi:hypothetical protein